MRMVRVSESLIQCSAFSFHSVSSRYINGHTQEKRQVREMKMTGIVIAALCVSLYGAPALAEKPSHVKHYGKNYSKHYRHDDGYRDRIRHRDGYRDRNRYSDRHRTYRRHRDRDIVEGLFFGITFGSPGRYRHESYRHPGNRFGHYKHRKHRYDRRHHRHFRGCGHDWDSRRHHRIGTFPRR